MRRALASFLACWLWAGAAHALLAEDPLPNATQERQAQQLFADMKCVVCEGQSLAASDAPFARQMRASIRHMVADGQTPAQIRHYFTARYGDAILLTPPLAPRTYLLWWAPLLLVLLGGWIVWRATHSPEKKS